MEIKFGKTTWWALANMAGSIRIGKCKYKEISKYRLEVQKKMMAGLAEAIEAEIKRVEITGEKVEGSVIFSLDLKIERFDADPPQKYNVIAELDKILNKKSPKKLLDW